MPADIPFVESVMQAGDDDPLDEDCDSPQVQRKLTHFSEGLGL